MNWIIPIKCPDCELPLDAEAPVCPYCYSTAPSRAPWQGRWSTAAIVMGLGLVVFSLAWVCDHQFGTNFVAQLKDVFWD